MNFDWLRAFVAFAEESSFTRAARRLHVSQPALHVQIGKLTRALGTPLYRRDGRGVVLTEDGRRLLASARDVLERADALGASLRSADPLRPVVVAGGEGAFLYLVADAIRTFASRRPGRLRLLTRDRDAAQEAVLLGEAHLAIAALETPAEGLDAEPIARVPAAVALPRGHPLARRRRVRPKDLVHLPLILPPPGRPHRAAVVRLLAPHGLDAPPAVEAGGWAMSLHFVRAGLGVAIVNAFCQPPPGVVLRPFPDLPPVTYFLLRRRGARLAAAVLEVADAIRTATRCWRTASPARPSP